MTITVRPGIYLEDAPPHRTQYRVGRRQPGIRSVVTVHTAESGLDLRGGDEKAENVAEFIRRRDTAGSYCLLGDRDSIIQLVRFENEAFHDGTGSNRWSVGISLAMNADAWPTLSVAHRAEYVESAATMAVMAARWMVSQGLEAPRAQLLTKWQSERPDASGFISHALRDPTRRSDPGRHFPWVQFLDRYSELLDGDTQMARIEDEDLVSFVQGYWNAENPERLLDVDGDWGPKTDGAVSKEWLANSLRVEHLLRLDDIRLSTSSDRALRDEIDELRTVIEGHGDDPDAELGRDLRALVLKAAKP